MHPREVFEQSVEVGPGCWLWRGKSFHDFGYGRTYYDGHHALAHRVAWELWNGEAVPPGMVVRHTCDNPPCVSPHHLVLGTRAENQRDMALRGRSTRKTHCLRGHELTDANRLPQGSGCRQCFNARARAKRAARRAVAA